MQSQSIQTTGYSVKPNITLFIYDSGSMDTDVGAPQCYAHYRKSTCINKIKYTYLGKTYWSCRQWDTSDPWSADEVLVGSIPGPTELSENDSTIIDYKYPLNCHRFTKMSTVNNILEQIINTYRNDFNYSVQPLNSHAEYEFRQNPQTGAHQQYVINTHPKYNQFYDTAKLQNYEFVIDTIKGNPAKGKRGLYADGGTPTFARINAVVRNTLMNKLKYRCQKSYLIILSDGEAGNDKPITDSTLQLNGRDFGYDGYFDGSVVRNEKMFDYYNREYLFALSYYTETLRTKNFGQYIYNSPIVDNWGQKYIETTKHSDRRLTDDAGQPCDAPDPLAHLPGHTPTFTQTAQTFTISFGLDASGDRRAVELMKNAASPKPDYDPVTNTYARYYFNAMTPDTVLKAFEDIFKEIAA